MVANITTPITTLIIMATTKFELAKRPRSNNGCEVVAKWTSAIQAVEIATAR